MKKNKGFLLVTTLAAAALIAGLSFHFHSSHARKLYWFIPDGMRAEPTEFTVYKWAQEGKLPNIKKIMSEGAYGYSIPDFPSHTPTNFASLMTGSHPNVHGIADGPMHFENMPLSRPSASGFASTSKKVPPIWKIMEEQGKNTVLLSIPGSTPPEIRKSTIRGRWGGWGADTQKMIFESEGKFAERKALGNAFRLFFQGARLTKFVKVTNGAAELEEHGLTIYASLNGAKDQMGFALKRDGKPDQVATLKEGEWSQWVPVELEFKGLRFPSQIRIKVIKIWKSGDFRVRVLYNDLNRLVTEPPTIAEELTRSVGPMVDHADNWPPQLIFEDEDKQEFLDEMRMSLDWHRRAVDAIYDLYKPDVFLQDIYTPNLMLESRWWQGAVDKSRKDYSPAKADAAWKDLLELYQGLDAIVGQAMQKADSSTLIVFSSDHGVCPLHRLVKLNNLFAKKGWLKFTIDPKTGEPSIDWKNTRVVYLKMANIFLNPKGLGGPWKRASGPEYEKLRREVIATLSSLEDSDGTRPLVHAAPWEEAKDYYQLPADRIGDLVLETRTHYFWYEEVDPTLAVFTDSSTTGFKQSIDARSNPCMWAPFLMWGPGVKKGVQLKEPISNVDQLPTILKLMGIPAPAYVQGRVVSEALE